MQRNRIEMESDDKFKEGTETIVDMTYPPNSTIEIEPEKPPLSTFLRIFAQNSPKNDSGHSDNMACQTRGPEKQNIDKLYRIVRSLGCQDRRPY